MTRHPLIKGWRKHLKARRVGKNFVKREMKLTYIGGVSGKCAPSTPLIEEF
jgi:hypothetical protein